MTHSMEKFERRHEKPLSYAFFEQYGRKEIEDDLKMRSLTKALKAIFMSIFSCGSSCT